MDPNFEHIKEYDEEIYDVPEKYLVLIAYDIVDNKRRTALARYLLGFGTRVQRSVFECMLTQPQYEKLLRGIAPYVSGQDDRLAVYKITQRAQINRFGLTILPDIDDVLIF